MKEVNRILNGATWADVLKSRQERLEQVGSLISAVAIVGLIALAFGALTRFKG